MYNNYLITESEVVTGKSQTEALPYGLLYELKKKNYSSGSRQFTAMRAFTDSFIVSNPGQNSAHSRQWTSPLENTFLYVKKKKKKEKKVLQNSPNKRWKKIPMLQNGLLRITRSWHSLSTISLYLRLLHFRRSMNELFKPCERLKLPVVIKNCRRGKPPDCLRLMILKAVLHLLVLKRGNLFDENY